MYEQTDLDSPIDDVRTTSDSGIFPDPFGGHGRWFARRLTWRTNTTTPSTTVGATEDAATQALIRRRVEEFARTIRTKDIDGVMSFYAPDIVSFDLDPPLRYKGADHKRRAWQEFFAVRTGPVITRCAR